MSDPGPTHGMAVVEPGVRIHFVSSGAGPSTVLLIHGFPQSWWKWRHVMPLLVTAGFRVVAVDYRGAGASSKPRTGYDKWTMAGDLNTVLRQHLQIADPVAVVGHDIGAMVAYAYAARYRDAVTKLAILDSLGIPGTAVFDALRASARLWHFGFHAVPDLPELLVRGREADYLRALVEERIIDPGRFTAAELNTYIRLYRAPGAMRAAFDLYRSFDKDVADSRANLDTHGKLEIPVLAVSGAATPRTVSMIDMMREFAVDVGAVDIEGTGHWLVEERPRQTTEAVLSLLC